MRLDETKTGNRHQAGRCEEERWQREEDYPRIVSESCHCSPENSGVPTCLPSTPMQAMEGSELLVIWLNPHAVTDFPSLALADDFGGIYRYQGDLAKTLEY